MEIEIAEKSKETRIKQTSMLNTHVKHTHTHTIWTQINIYKKNTQYVSAPDLWRNY